jgi:hypothetical protein
MQPLPVLAPWLATLAASAIASLVLITTACAPPNRVVGANPAAAAGPPSMRPGQDAQTPSRFFGDEYDAAQRALIGLPQDPVSPTF